VTRIGDSLGRDRRDWTDLAALDPLWAVWSTPEFRHGASDAAAFLRRGEDEIGELLGYITTVLGRQPALGRALDFGCGAGRLTQALAGRFDEVVGVDISPGMVDTARGLNGRANCRFEVNPHPDLRDFADGHFDLVCSFITLQHISSRPAIERFLGEFVRVTAPGGVAAFQVLSVVPLRVRAHPRRHLYRLARDLRVPARVLYRLGLYSMALTPIPRDRVDRVVEACGGTVLGAYPDGRSGSDAIPSLTYYVTPS